MIGQDRDDVSESAIVIGCKGVAGKPFFINYADAEALKELQEWREGQTQL